MTQTFERELTSAEIEERTQLRDKLDDERDDLLAAVELRRREIRGFNASRKKIEARLLDVRREIRSGKVLESPQVSLALDLALPDPFAAKYPMARDTFQLHSELAVVLQGVLVPSREKLEKWHPSTPVFQEVANWARIELAYMNQKTHPDLGLPSRMPMPEALAELRMYLGGASKRAARPARPRPVSATPARTGLGRRTKRGEARK